jgi:hypothetical protein
MPTATWPDLTAAAGRDTTPLDVAARERAPRRLRVVLTRYLALAVVLLALVLVVDPHEPDRAAPGARPWAYQKESLELEGGGILNAYSRAVMGGTAWLTRGSIERVRDLNRLNLMDFLVGEPAARRLADWRADRGRPLEQTTRLAVLGLVFYGVVARPSRRTWLLALLLLLAATLVITKPQTTVRVASAPSVGIPNLALAVFGGVDPGQPPDPGRGTDLVAETLATQYWNGFVANPLSRLQTGTDVLSEADPERKPGVLAQMREQLSAVNDWALGRRGIERALISTLSLLYVLPFAIGVSVAAMVGSSAQVMLFLLTLAGLVVVPLAADRRRRPAAVSLWLLPLLATAGVLAVASLAALVVMRVAAALHALDEYLGMLLAGSFWPLLVIALLRWRALRLRRAREATSTANQGAP